MFDRIVSPSLSFVNKNKRKRQYAGSIDNNLKAMIVDKSKTSQFTESCSQSGFRENTAAAGRSVIADRGFV